MLFLLLALLGTRVSSHSVPPLKSPGSLKPPLKASGVKVVSSGVREMKTCAVILAALLLPSFQEGELRFISS